MKKFFFIIMILSLCRVGYGQDENSFFEQTKGRWDFPISLVQSIDTMTRDCFGFPAKSYLLTLTSGYAEEVKAVQSGIVTEVIMTGDSYVVVVKKGDYFLGYAGVSNPVVKKGDSIQRGDRIGTMTKGDTENVYSLTLMLTKGINTININRWFNWKIILQVAV